MKKFQQLGGFCAIIEALIYISAFIVYGAILTFPSSNAGITERLNFLLDNYLLLSIVNFTSYVLFGIVLVVLVLAIHQRLKNYSPIMSNLTSAFGLIWVGLVLASGMIANIGLNHVTQMGINEPENAMLVWASVGIVTDGLGGGNEIVGGIWVLLLSIIALKGQLFSKSLAFTGVFVGAAGILTIFPIEVFTEIFGISQIVWFVWIGIYMIRNNPMTSMDSAKYAE